MGATKERTRASTVAANTTIVRKVTYNQAYVGGAAEIIHKHKTLKNLLAFFAWLAYSSLIANFITGMSYLTDLVSMKVFWGP